MLRAGAAHLAGDRDGAVVQLEDARARLEHTNTRALEACVKYRLGELLGGDAGTSLRAEAELWMARQDIASPARTAALFLPGWPHPDR